MLYLLKKKPSGRPWLRTPVLLSYLTIHQYVTDCFPKNKKDAAWEHEEQNIYYILLKVF